MKRIVVGILPQIRLKETNNPYLDRYEFLDLYCKRIIEAGGIPVGLCLNKGKLDRRSLDLCDAFLLPGGNKVDRCYYETIEYCLKNDKPLLGICLGMQSISIYSSVIERKENIDVDDDFFEVYRSLKDENGGSLLYRIESPNIHGDVIVDYDNVDDARHEVSIDENSRLYDILKKSKIDAVSLHSFGQKHIGKDFKVAAKAKDGLIEAIEYAAKNRFIIGVLWHPEWDDDCLLFKALIDEAVKRKIKRL